MPSITQTTSTITKKLHQLVVDAKEMHLPLPSSFFTLMSDPILQDRKPFSHFYFDLPERMRKSTLFDECYFIRFLRESGGALSWHLYLKPSGEHCVIASHTDLSDEYPLNRWFATGEQLTLEILMENTFFCAPSFEEFIYRFWIEHHMFIALTEGRALTEEQKAYLAHYRF